MRFGVVLGFAGHSVPVCVLSSGYNSVGCVGCELISDYARDLLPSEILAFPRLHSLVNNRNADEERAGVFPFGTLLPTCEPTPLLPFLEWVR